MTPTANQLLLAHTALDRTEDELLTDLGIALAGGPELTRLTFRTSRVGYLVDYACCV